MGTNKILRRIEKEAGVTDLIETLSERVKPSDLQSLLIEVYKRHASRRKPRMVFSDYVSNRLVSPSPRDLALLLEWDRVAFSHLPEGFRAIELSPICPLGTVSSIAPISQNWVFTTIRNNEVVADPTNVLALECAVRRHSLARSNPTDATPVHLACSHRVVRAQRYQHPSLSHHFRLFSLCSAGRDTGSLRFETDAVGKHVRFYLNALRHFLEPGVSLRTTVADLSRDSRYTKMLTALVENLQKEFQDVYLGVERSRIKETGYYGKLRFHIYARPGRAEETELVDGGDTDWTQKLLNNAKERLITSAIGSERLCEKFAPKQRLC